MRRLGQGQTLRVWLIPEVGRLVASTARLCQRPASRLSLVNDTMAWLVVNSLRGEKLQAAKLQDLQRATVVRTPAIQRLLGIIPTISRSMLAAGEWDAETDKHIEALAAENSKELARISKECRDERDAELGKHRAAKYRSKPPYRRSDQGSGKRQEAVDAWMKELETEAAQIQKDVEGRADARCEALMEAFEAKQAAVRVERAPGKPAVDEEEMRLSLIHI